MVLAARRRDRLDALADTLVVDGGHSIAMMRAAYGEELYNFHAAIVPGGLGERIMPELARAGA